MKITKPLVNGTNKKFFGIALFLISFASPWLFNILHVHSDPVRHEDHSIASNLQGLNIVVAICTLN